MRYSFHVCAGQLTLLPRDSQWSSASAPSLREDIFFSHSMRDQQLYEGVSHDNARGSRDASRAASRAAFSCTSPYAASCMTSRDTST